MRYKTSIDSFSKDNQCFAVNILSGFERTKHQYDKLTISHVPDSFESGTIYGFTGLVLGSNQNPNKNLYIKISDIYKQFDTDNFDFNIDITYGTVFNGTKPGEELQKCSGYIIVKDSKTVKEKISNFVEYVQYYINEKYENSLFKIDSYRIVSLLEGIDTDEKLKKES